MDHDCRKRYRRVAMSTWVIVALVIIGLTSVFPIDATKPDSLERTASTCLGIIWLWLRVNHDPIESVAQVASAAGVLFAVAAYWRSQHLDQVNWIRQVYQDIAELDDKSLPTTEAYKRTIEYYSIAFSAFKFRLVDDETWNVVRTDMRRMVEDPIISAWVTSPNAKEGFPDDFISYLGDLVKETKKRRGG